MEKKREVSERANAGQKNEPNAARAEQRDAPRNSNAEISPYTLLRPTERQNRRTRRRARARTHTHTHAQRGQSYDEISRQTPPAHAVRSSTRSRCAQVPVHSSCTASTTSTRMQHNDGRTRVFAISLKRSLRSSPSTSTLTQRTALARVRAQRRQRFLCK